jgi:FemAB-related protein (PEP-CTERM system-associated)
VKALGRSVVTERHIRTNTNVAPGAWDRYAAAHPDATAYHRHGWLEVIRSAFGHEITGLAAEFETRIVGLLPLVHFRSRLFGRFTVSIPFLNYGGVLADDEMVEQALLSRAIEITRDAGGSHLELRHTRQHFAELTPLSHKVAMTVRLEASVARQWDGLDRKVRNQVRKAEKSGLSCVDGGAELLPRFYAVFARNMRDLGTPVYSARFFRAVLERFSDTTRVFVVTSAGRPVAASLVHWHRATLEVPWASALREFNPLCANVFLYWHMLRFGVERGLTTFDFGRSSPDSGTFQFKRQWGAEPTPLVWEYWTAGGRPLPQLNPANPKFSMAIRAWQRLPVPLATALGPFIVRNIP